MARTLAPKSPDLTRDQQIQALMDQLRPKVEAAVRSMIERAVDAPEAQEFGAIEYEFRDAGQQLANDVRQATLASRKKRATSAAASPVPIATTPPNSTPTRSDGS